MKRLLFLLLTISLLILVAACGGPQAEGPAAQPTEQAEQPADGAEPTQPAQTDDGAEPTEPAQTSAEQPSKLVIVQSASIENFEPTVRQTTSTANALVNIYDGLVKQSPDMKSLEPGLATSWELVDDTTWEFKLREGVEFHNGEPFNADTVLAWFERLQTLTDRIEGYNSSIGHIPAVESVEKVDDYTVRFLTEIPDPVLPRRLSSYFLLIPPKQYIEENGGDQALFDKTVGTGPYKFVEWVKDDHLLLEANEDYWGGAPAIKQIEIRPVPEASARFAALQAGEAQIADAIPPAVMPQVEEAANLDIRSVPEATRTYWWYITSENSEPLGDVKVRQALNYAVDKQALIDELLSGHAKQTASIVTFQSFGYCDVPEYEYDPEKARELLSEAGYADGFDLTINYSPGHYLAQDEIVQATGNYLQEVGINVEYQTFEWLTYLDEIFTKNLTGIFYVGKTNLAVDADYMFREFEPDANFGWPFPLQGEGMELYQQERQEMDPEQRAELACDLQKWFRDQAGVLFLWQQDIVFAASNEVDWQPRGDGFLYGVDMQWAQ